MLLSALLTSAGINIGLCALMVSLYSVLRRQPENFSVYFGRRLAEETGNRVRGYFFERLVPSPTWILKAWEYTEDDILTIAGLDAVVFLRILVFSIRIFSIAAVVCVFGVLPLNYFGQEMRHRQIPSESLDVFTIANVKEGSQWLGIHCLALYIITFSAVVLLYFEYKNLARRRIHYITKSPPNPSHFSVLVRAIPKSTEEAFSDSVRNFFTNYHGSSYLSHQIICKTGKVQKLMMERTEWLLDGGTGTTVLAVPGDGMGFGPETEMPCSVPSVPGSRCLFWRTLIQALFTIVILVFIVELNFM